VDAEIDSKDGGGGRQIAIADFLIPPESPIGNSQSSMTMRLIVGLGNPGAEYEWSRHNLGFLIIDKVSTEAGIRVTRSECRSLVGVGQWEESKVKLVKPQTYMNLSGESVGCLLAKHRLKEPGEKLIVISDDLALPFGKIRIRARGSAGGHNGLKSIIETIGSDEFVRLRIGIQPEHPITDTRRFVLDSFPRAQRDEVGKILERSIDALRTILRDGVLRAMTRFN
jgi:PTH1 family peptidyl-tRNA hydrolase